MNYSASKTDVMDFLRTVGPVTLQGMARVFFGDERTKQDDQDLKVLLEQLAQENMVRKNGRRWEAVPV